MAKVFNTDIFNLKNHLDEPELLESSDPVSQTTNEYKMIPIDKCIYMENQPFRMYNNTEKWEEFVDSIRMFGVHEPIVVRPTLGKYQIIAGRHRHLGSQEAGKTTIPAIIRNDIDDSTARIMMLDTNLQRADEYKISELAFAYKERLEIENRQGFRSDLASRNNFEMMNDESSRNDFVKSGNESSRNDFVKSGNESSRNDFVKSGNESSRNNFAKSGDEASRNDFARMDSAERRKAQMYARLTKLIKPLLDMADAGNLVFVAAYHIAAFPDSHQRVLNEYLEIYKPKVTQDHAKLLAMHSKNGDFGYSTISEIFGKYPEICSAPAKKKTFKISYSRLEQYVKPDATPQETEEYILEALEFYGRHKAGQMI
ncbi:ParB/RepB/Spo0J family partition protein (plasmid) [Oscillospiraceae bacterium MB08-C2-2]|nr:ParB/RepB/Spo0J family partition protein [Oscillospiraceae bacterium MB08-C2-2]